MYLFFAIFRLMEPNNFCATVKLASKNDFRFTDVAHAVDVLHQFLVICLDSHCCLLGHFLHLIHLLDCV